MVLIHTFLLLDFAWCGSSELLSNHQKDELNTLSPRVNISTLALQKMYLEFYQYPFQPESTLLSISSTPENLEDDRDSQPQNRPSSKGPKLTDVLVRLAPAVLLFLSGCKEKAEPLSFTRQEVVLGVIAFIVVVSLIGLAGKNSDKSKGKEPWKGPWEIMIATNLGALAYAVSGNGQADVQSASIVPLAAGHTSVYLIVAGAVIIGGWGVWRKICEDRAKEELNPYREKLMSSTRSSTESYLYLLMLMENIKERIAEDIIVDFLNSLGQESNKDYVFAAIILALRSIASKDKANAVTEAENKYKRIYGATTSHYARERLSDFHSSIEMKQPRDKHGNFGKKPGRSADDALTVIALSPYLQAKIEEDGYFTLPDYHQGYNEVRLLYPQLGFTELPLKSPDAQSRRDLKRLVTTEYLSAIKPSRGKRGLPRQYYLTGKGLDEVAVRQREMQDVQPNQGQDHNGFNLTNLIIWLAPVGLLFLTGCERVLISQAPGGLDGWRAKVFIALSVAVVIYAGVAKQIQDKEKLKKQALDAKSALNKNGAKSREEVFREETRKLAMWLLTVLGVSSLLGLIYFNKIRLLKLSKYKQNPLLFIRDFIASLFGAKNDEVVLGLTEGQLYGLFLIGVLVGFTGLLYIVWRGTEKGKQDKNISWGIMIASGLGSLAYSLSGDAQTGVALASVFPFMGAGRPELGRRPRLKPSFPEEFNEGVTEMLALEVNAFRVFMQLEHYPEAARSALILHDLDAVRQEDSYQNDLDFGTAFFETRQYELAIPHFEQALKIIAADEDNFDLTAEVRSDRQDIHFKLGTANLMLSRMQTDAGCKAELLREAVSNLENADQYDYMVKVNLITARGELVEAESAAEEILEDTLVVPPDRDLTDEEQLSLRRGYITRVNNRGRRLNNAGKFEEAISCFQEALRVAKGAKETKKMLPNIYLAIGEAYLAQEKYQQARDTLEYTSRLPYLSLEEKIYVLAGLSESYFFIMDDEKVESLAEEVSGLCVKHGKRFMNSANQKLYTALARVRYYFAQSLLNSSDAEKVRQSQKVFMEAVVLFAKAQDYTAMAQAKEKANGIDRLFSQQRLAAQKQNMTYAEQDENSLIQIPYLLATQLSPEPLISTHAVLLIEQAI